MAGLPPDSPAERVDPNSVMSLWAGVVSVSVPAGVFSGVVVGPRHVLTAAHVLEGFAPPDVSVTVNLDYGGGRWLKIRSILPHPRYRGFERPFAWYDLALLELAQPLPSATPVYQLGFDRLSVGVEARIVGYGGSGAGHREVEIPASTAVKRVGGNHLDRFVSLPDATRSQAVFIMDFDGPGVRNALGKAGLPNDVETAPAHGDSGAPVFVGENRDRRLVGLITFVEEAARRDRPTGSFGTRSGGVLLAPSREWLESVLGPTPPASPAPSTGGAATGPISGRPAVWRGRGP